MAPDYGGGKPDVNMGPKKHFELDHAVNAFVFLIIDLFSLI